MGRIKINRKKYPQVGETFYWKDEDNDIHEATCMKIEGEDIDTLETMFFIYISNNGGGTFVTESDIVDSNSKEVIEFKKKQAKQKVNEIIEYLSREEIHTIVYSALRKSYNEDDASNILETLVDKTNYE